MNKRGGRAHYGRPVGAARDEIEGGGIGPAEAVTGAHREALGAVDGTALQPQVGQLVTGDGNGAALGDIAAGGPEVGTGGGGDRVSELVLGGGVAVGVGEGDAELGSANPLGGADVAVGSTDHRQHIAGAGGGLVP